MQTFGLVGSSLTHSFSPKFFNEFFKKNYIDAKYELYELKEIGEISKVFEKQPSGLNVTIPFKEVIMPFLDEIDDAAIKIGAVNTIAFNGNLKLGFNTDIIGFRQSIKPFLTNQHERALLIGTGGSAKAVSWTLKNIGLDVFFISRSPVGKTKTFGFDEINAEMIRACKLIINCTPIGMFPNTTQTINLPYTDLTSDHLVIDLIYNPAETNFLREAKKHGAVTLNGETMLHQQALASWKIWNDFTKV